MGPPDRSIPDQGTPKTQTEKSGDKTMTTFDLGQEGNAFPFDEIGASVTGTVLNLEELQQTDMDTGEPEFWPNKQPKMMYRLTLQTELRDDPADDGVRAIYLRGSRKPESKSSLAACLGAVKRATGSTQISAGARYTHTYTGDGVPTRKGWNPPKEYEGNYVPPKMDLEGGNGAVPAASKAQVNAATTVEPGPSVHTAGPDDPWTAVILSGKYSADQISAMQAANIDPAKL